MKRSSKPSAADRTLDLYAKAVIAAAPKIEDATNEDALDKPRQAGPNGPNGPETIETASRRWRDNAFYGQELLSKHFNDAPEDKANTATFRLTSKDGWLFLEQYRHGKDGMAYHWSGVMFPYSDLYELAGVIVKAAKEKQSRES